jgi:hypothetical protein
MDLEDSSSHGPHDFSLSLCLAGQLRQSDFGVLTVLDCVRFFFYGLCVCRIGGLGFGCLAGRLGDVGSLSYFGRLSMISVSRQFKVQ